MDKERGPHPNLTTIFPTWMSQQASKRLTPISPIYRYIGYICYNSPILTIQVCPERFLHLFSQVQIPKVVGDFDAIIGISNSPGAIEAWQNKKIGTWFFFHQISKHPVFFWLFQSHDSKSLLGKMVGFHIFSIHYKSGCLGACIGSKNVAAQVGVCWWYLVVLCLVCKFVIFVLVDVLLNDFVLSFMKK